MQKTIDDLEASWDFESGFFGKLRQGSFDHVALNRLLETLHGITIVEQTVLPKRLVSLLWYMPLFMVWQRERVCELCDDMHEYDQTTNRIEQIVERILGIP
jgi:hypothetical protein